jgi:hypothetical protein
MNTSNEKREEQKKRSTLNEKREEQKKLAVDNIKYIMMYSLAFVVAMGVNDVMTTAFSEKEKRKHIFGKIIYVMIVLTITIIFAYFFHSKFQN